ncbi:MAG: hypothetical protein CFE24_02245 [Flavobacterium sp. BFFFF2]|nr:MAG: hypothetical protein CFE24_02245 [Flavobacterium sp. BFFFF2]
MQSMAQIKKIRIAVKVLFVVILLICCKKKPEKKAYTDPYIDKIKIVNFNGNGMSVEKIIYIEYLNNGNFDKKIRSLTFNIDRILVWDDGDFSITVDNINYKNDICFLIIDKNGSKEEHKLSKIKPALNPLGTTTPEYCAYFVTIENCIYNGKKYNDFKLDFEHKTLR